MESIKMRTETIESKWSIVVDGYFTNKMQEKLIDEGVSISDAEEILFNSVRVLSNLSNPLDDNYVSKTGIVIGKVQSGKTSNFISLIALGFDNNYNLAIVLGGNKNNLLEQNKVRLEKYFDNVSNSEVIILTTRSNKSIVNGKEIVRFLKQGKRVILLGLKHYKHISLISEIFKGGELEGHSALIIDDEGDQATLNAPGKGKEMSSTYEQTLSLKKAIDKHCFLSITATPQANLLIDTIDLLSPDFGVLIYPSKLYCGLNDFHGVNQDKYIRIIPDNEISIVDDIGIPESFVDALAFFFIGAAIRRFRNDFGNHAMLVHPSQSKIDHRVVYKKIKKLLDIWKQKADSIVDNFNEISNKYFISKFENIYSDVKVSNDDYPEFNVIKDLIFSCVSECAPPHICNSDEDASENSKYFKINIFVGGNMLERGITIKGLAVTYIVRSAKGKSNVDNTEQRARWFGYKRDILDVCRVYTTKRISEDFTKISEHEENLWSMIEQSMYKGEHFKDLSRIFKLKSDTLNLTRNTISKTIRIDLDSWSFQKKFDFEHDNYTFNDKITTDFFNDRGSDCNMLTYANVSHQVLGELTWSDLHDNLVSKLNKTDELKEIISIIAGVNSRLISEGVKPLFTLVQMRSGEVIQRSINEYGQINQLFQGSNGKIGDANYYPGDRNILITDSSILVQIYRVQARIDGKPSDNKMLTFAFRISDEYLDKLSGYVKGERNDIQNRRNN